MTPERVPSNSMLCPWRRAMTTAHPTALRRGSLEWGPPLASVATTRSATSGTLPSKRPLLSSRIFSAFEARRVHEEGIIPRNQKHGCGNLLRKATAAGDSLYGLVKVLDQILRSTLPYQHTTQPNYRRSFFSTLCSYGLLVGLSLDSGVKHAGYTRL